MIMIYKFRANRSQRDSRDFYNYDEENYSFFVTQIQHNAILLVAVAVLRSFWLDLICRNASCGVSNILDVATNFFGKYLQHLIHDKSCSLHHLQRRDLNAP